jgi:hypothetical protein
MGISQRHHDRTISSRHEPDHDVVAFGDGGGNEDRKLSIPVEESTCSICLREFSEADTWLSCAHRFHSGCIEEWQKTCNQTASVTCPICRSTTRLSEEDSE